MAETYGEDDITFLLSAIKFSAEKHATQRRKDVEQTAYINHPIAVGETLWRVGGVRELPVIVAAILHDTIEDTGTTAQEIKDKFGSEVAELVLEVTDDKSLPKQERKQLQIEHAAGLSRGAKLIKLGDKISNVTDVSNSPPQNWSNERRIEYLDWTERVVAGLVGTNNEMEAMYSDVLRQAREKLSREAPARGSSLKNS